MIALTDQAVKHMIETRLGIPAIWTTETVALMLEADQRFQLPKAISKYREDLEKQEKGSSKIVFPFCAFSRMTGGIDDMRVNLALGKYGLITEHVSEDKTRVSRIRMIPMNYPYAVKYYVTKFSQSIQMEKKYYGLRLDPGLHIKFPVGFDSNFVKFYIWVSSLDGFDPPVTDEIYSKGEWFTGNLGITVNTWIAEDVEAPLIQKIDTEIYDEDVPKYLGSWIISKKTWGN